MLHFVLPFHCSASFNFQALFAFSRLTTVGSSLTFSVLFLLFCYFNILFLYFNMLFFF